MLAVAVPTIFPRSKTIPGPSGPLVGAAPAPTTAPALVPADVPPTLKAPPGSRVRAVTAEDLVEAAGDLTDPVNRAAIAPLLERLEAAERRAARVRARALGLPVRIETPDGQVGELAGFDGAIPRYTTVNRAGTSNTEAAEIEIFR